MTTRPPAFEPKRITYRLGPGTNYDVELLMKTIGMKQHEVIDLALKLGLARILQLAQPDDAFYANLMESTEADIVTVETAIKRLSVSRE